MPPTLPTMDTFSNRSLARLWGPQCQSQWQTLSWRTWRKEHSAPSHTHHPHTGNGRKMTRSQLYQKTKSIGSWTISTRLNPRSSSPWRRSQMGHSLSWTLWSPTMVMGPCPHQCTERKPTQTATWTSPPTTPLHTRLLWQGTLMTRADRICTFVPDRDKEKQHIAEALNNNGCPSQHVNKNWWPRSSSRPSSSEEPPKATVVIPYIRHLSESICRILTPLKVRTCFRPHRTLKQMSVSLKDHIPRSQRAGVVYRIPCGNCEKVYIGQTGRTLDHRLKEHR